MRTCDKCGVIRPDSQDTCDCETATGRRQYRKARRWRGACLSIVLLFVLAVGWFLLTVPCSEILPAQDGMNGSSLELGTQALMRRIVDAESRYYAQNERYGGFSEMGFAPRSGSELFSSGYTIRLTVQPSHFQLSAIPAPRSSRYCCILGIPHCRYFYTDETQVLRQDAHCRPATVRSSAMDWPVIARP